MCHGDSAVGPAVRCFSLPSCGTSSSWLRWAFAEFMEVSLGSILGAGRGAETQPSPKEDG